MDNLVLKTCRGDLEVAGDLDEDREVEITIHTDPLDMYLYIYLSAFQAQELGRHLLDLTETR